MPVEDQEMDSAEDLELPAGEEIDGPYQVVHQCTDPLEAEFAQGVLRKHGIPSTVAGTRIAALLGAADTDTIVVTAATAASGAGATTAASATAGSSGSVVTGVLMRVLALRPRIERGDSVTGVLVHITAAEVLSAHHLAGSGLNQRWSCQKDGAVTLDDDALVSHSREIGTPGGARPHDYGDLWNSPGGKTGLVIEDPAKMVAVGKNLILLRQVDPA